MAKNNLSGWSLTLLRVVLGIILAYHGYLKLFVPGGFKGTVEFFASVGIPLTSYSALVASVAEFAGGIFLIVGVLTRLTTLALLFEMLVALFTVHIKNGLLVSNGGYEFVLLILAALVVLLTNGSGSLSIGKMMSKNKWLQ
ncbi:DoxX family protein [Candidatus Woesearchaeota archaeon]|nr:DoxX family protein [Candidatus Woesearchaeota archaeon]